MTNEEREYRQGRFLEIVSLRLTTPSRAIWRALWPAVQRRRTSFTSIIVNSRKLIGTSRRRPAPSSEGTVPWLGTSVVVPGYPANGMKWLHDPGDRVAP